MDESKRRVGKPPKPWIKQLVDNETSEAITVAQIEEKYDIDKRSAWQFFKRHKINFINEKYKNNRANYYKLSDIRAALEGLV